MNHRRVLRRSNDTQYWLNPAATIYYNLPFFLPVLHCTVRGPHYHEILPGHPSVSSWNLQMGEREIAKGSNDIRHNMVETFSDDLLTARGIFGHQPHSLHWYVLIGFLVYCTLPSQQLLLPNTSWRSKLWNQGSTHRSHCNGTSSGHTVSYKDDTMLHVQYVVIVGTSESVHWIVHVLCEVAYAVDPRCYSTSLI